MTHSRTVVATFLAAMSRSATTLSRLLPSGKAALVLSPLELLELLDRLAALIPTPRRHRHHCHRLFAPPQIEPEGVGSLNPDAQIPNRHAQPDHSPPLDATCAENTPFGFPIRRN